MLRCPPPLVRILCAALALSFICPPAQLLAGDPPAEKAAQAEEEDVEPVLDLTPLERVDVDPTTGELSFSSQDLVVGEGPSAFSLTRTWRPFSGDAADFGHHWASPLSIHLDVDKDGERAGLVDAEGIRTFFRKDASSGQLRSISGRTGEVAARPEGGWVVTGLGDDRSYRFDQEGFLREVTGPGLVLRYGWDAGQRLTSIDGPWGRIALERDDAGRLERVVAPGEAAVSYLFDEGDLVRVARRGSHETYGYDSLGRLRSLADGQAQVSWDGAGRVTALRGEGVRPVSLSYLASDEPERALTTTVVREGRTTTVAVSADRRRMAWSQDGSKETVVQLDAREQPVSLAHADGRAWSWKYDARGRVLETKSPTGTVSYRYESKVTSRPTRVELEDGRVVDLSYDLKGQLTKLVTSGAEQSWTYDAKGRVSQATDARGAVTRYTWDERSLLIGVEEVGLGTTRLGRDPQGRVRAVKTESGQLIRVEYDPQGRVRLVHDARGTIMAAEYDPRGNLVRYVDELGQETTWDWNAKGELVEAHDAVGLIGKWTYAQGRLASFQDGAGNETRWKRPDARTLVIEDPTTGTQTLSYDAVGRLVKEVKAGVELGYRYDALGNLAVRTTPAGEETFARDGLGRLIGMAGPAGALEMRWDEDGRLAAIKEKAFGREVGYGYSPAGDRTELRLPWGTVKYRYDAHGRVTGIDLPSGEAIEIALDASGRRQSITYPNGVVTRFGWERGRLVEVSTSKGKETLDLRKYGWGARGRLEWMEDAAGKRTTYEHDARGRLIAADGPQGKQTWAYDLADNRTSQSAAGQETQIAVGAGNRVTAHGETKLEHGPTGAVSAIGATRLVHDHDDHLVRVENPDGTKVEYGYAPNGTRLWRQDAKGRTWYLNDLSDVVAELDAEGKVIAGYVHGPESDDVLAAVKGGETYYYHYDLVRSVTAVTGKNGRVAARYSYDAFGRQQEAQGDAVAWNPFRYTSREHDQATGLYHYRARTYSTELGRFTSPDPLGRMGGFNLYAYVGNDPTIFNDPFGLDPKKPWWKRAWDTVADATSSAVNATKAFATGLVNDFAESSFGKRAISFGKGFGKGVWSGVKGLYNLVRHPVETWNGLVYAVENWDETKEAILAKWDEYKEAFANDPEKFWEMTGQLTGEVLMSVVGTKGIGAVASTTSKVAKAADLTRRASTLARTTGVTRLATTTGNAINRATPGLVNTVRTGSRWSSVRNVELARRAAAPGNILSRTGRRFVNVGRDMGRAGRMAVRNPGAFVVYTGHRMSKAAAALVASTGRGVWGATKNLGPPLSIAFEDQITDAIRRHATRESAIKEVAEKGESLLKDADKLSAGELERRLADVSGAYDTYRNRLMAPVHALDEELGRRLTELSNEVKAGRLAPEAIDARMDALLLEFARKRMVVLADIYGRNKDAAHSMFDPSPNRLVAYQDEAAFLDEMLKKVTDPRARAVLEARKAELAEKAALEEERYGAGDFEALISGVAGPPRDPGTNPDGTLAGDGIESSSLDDLIAPAAPVDDEAIPGLEEEEPAPTPGPPPVPGGDVPDWGTQPDDQ